MKTEITVSIDPGYRYCGVAVFSDEVLVTADLVEAKKWEVEAQQFAETAKCVWEFLETTVDKASLSAAQFAIEYPQQYTFSPAPREAVQRLVGTIGAILGKVQSETSGLSVRVSTYKPREWKGQVPKEIMAERILSRLSSDEVNVIPAMSKSKAHNVTDAVGVGLHHLKRLKRKRVARQSNKAAG